MTWLLLIPSGLVLAGVVMAVVGARLPVAHVARRSARFTQAPAELFAEVEKLVREQRDVKVDVTERAPPQRLVTTLRPGGPFGGTWTYELSPDGGGTRLEITERGEVYHPVFRFLSRYVFGHTATLDGFLKRLGGRPEPG
ncbi:MAG: hypothetical protein IPJ65_05325 [Archangiaceae bacterium]|nr:hypothetical protein [Archangiaceae bacterium]